MTRDYLAMKALAGVLAALLCSVQCGPFTVQIFAETIYTIGQDIHCVISITNNDDKDYHLLTRQTPLEGLLSDIFAVSNGREMIPYDGVQAKRIEFPSTEEEYIFIRAKSSSLSYVDLSDAYSFDSSGVYTVQLEVDLQFYESIPTAKPKGATTKFETVKLKLEEKPTTWRDLHDLNFEERPTTLRDLENHNFEQQPTTLQNPDDLNIEDKPTTQHIEPTTEQDQESPDLEVKYNQQVLSNRVTFFLVRHKQEKPKPTEGDLARRNASTPTPPEKNCTFKPPKIVGECTREQLKCMTQAYQLAFAAIMKSIKSACVIPIGEEYKMWFGKKFKKKVKNVFTTMKRSIKTTEYTLCCGSKECKNNWYGYTYKGSTKIYLCKLFFEAKLKGTDSKLGVIVHELSHAAACTDDHEYGQRRCKELAKRDPKKACNNADSYEYFAEAQKC